MQQYSDLPNLISFMWIDVMVAILVMLKKWKISITYLFSMY